ncbi:hypothetical protein AVEN_45554-1 [Araneus ventricosus]|uniref:Uncharacterized protein n=1 Tax=Araneus ventricosus TaxID=182803 RepID=A0A4Y2IF78_ARAVE|nr:hypothetical protein AVEN_45554-1 [Araneus ventricosus]
MTRTTPELAPPSPNFHATPTGGRLATTYDLACNRPPYTADLQWNRVSNLEPSGPKAETLPLGHRGLPFLTYKQPFDATILHVSQICQKLSGFHMCMWCSSPMYFSIMHFVS